MNSWIVLLSTTLRLVDLHDSNHERHSDHTRVSLEKRTGHQDGYWLGIACQLLEYLLEEDYQTNGQFIPQSRCLNNLRELIPELNADDLSYVINTLSTPSELFFTQQVETEKRRTASTKQTALLEKQSKIGHVRLSQAGRQSVTLSRQVDDILYSEHDAAKIISAIARSDFDRIPPICDSILLSIRGLTQEIRRIRENPALEGKLDSFRNNRKYYQSAVRNIQATVMDCQKQFLRQEIRERFNQWAQQQPDEWELQMLDRPLIRILSALENLNRRLTDLLRDIAEGRIQSMGIVDFNKAALNLAWQPPGMELMESVFQQLAPIDIAVTIPSPADYQGLLDNQRADTSSTSLVYDDGSDETPESLKLKRFLSHHGQVMRERLQQGPLPLSEAICNGWHQFSNEDRSVEDCLPQLINMFVDTEQLRPDLAVAIDTQSLNIVLPDGRRLHGDNPILMTVEKSTKKLSLEPSLKPSMKSEEPQL
ncbi:hypothetical protein [Endozoicomonas atrinae]|uniref:hypothetical protein n=1 Tax=Endozoicomonas atrinae TaxID=1333660 RepID=UPI000AD583DB|nr:hypothetical protein [Endozoicomonas atrinae]